VKKRHKITIVLLAGALLIGVPFKLSAGKSVRFFLDSGLRAPLDAEVIESGNRFMGRDGEWIYVFKTDDETIRDYLCRAPWQDCRWQEGPVPNEALGITKEISPLVRYLSREGMWYMHQQPIRSGHDEGRLIILDASAKRVYFSSWWW
jgi:hypothetical protein